MKTRVKFHPACAFQRPAKTIPAVLAALFLVGTASAASFPPCAPPVEMANMQVMRVASNGTIVLTDGRAAKLEGILLPGGARDHAPSFLTAQAISELNDFTNGRLVTLAAKPPKEDRYGRVRAQAFSEKGDWLQIALLRKGLARVFIAPDRDECASDLYAAEREARARNAGIWAQLGYEIRDAADVPRTDLGTFQIVQGRVTNAEVRGGRAYLNFGSNWRDDFTATVSPEDIKVFHAAGIEPIGYAGKLVRVRGVVEQLNGPEIELATPDDIEVIADPKPSPADAKLR